MIWMELKLYSLTRSNREHIRGVRFPCLAVLLLTGGRYASTSQHSQIVIRRLTKVKGITAYLNPKFGERLI